MSLVDIRISDWETVASHAQYGTLCSDVGCVINVCDINHTMPTRDCLKAQFVAYRWFCTREDRGTNIVATARRVWWTIRALGIHPSQIVVVHCWAGINRSAACAVYVRMVEYCESYDEALATVRRARPQACIMPHFQKQLRDAEQALTENRMIGDCSLYVCLKTRHMDI